MKKLTLLSLLLLLPLSLSADVRRTFPPDGGVVVQRQPWAQANQVYVFRPQVPQVSLYLFFSNLNPTSAQTVTVRVYQTPDPTLADWTNNQGLWVQDTINGSACTDAPVEDCLLTVPAASMRAVYVTTMFARQIAVRLTGAATQAGSPDTVSIFLVQGIGEPLGQGPGSPTGTVTVVGALPAGTNNIGDVDVLSLPALPAGTNNIGDVDIASALPAGTNKIGAIAVEDGNGVNQVDVVSATPATGSLGVVTYVTTTPESVVGANWSTPINGLSATGLADGLLPVGNSYLAFRVTYSGITGSPLGCRLELRSTVNPLSQTVLSLPNPPSESRPLAYFQGPASSAGTASAVLRWTCDTFPQGGTVDVNMVSQPTGAYARTEVGHSVSPHVSWNSMALSQAFVVTTTTNLDDVTNILNPTGSGKSLFFTRFTTTQRTADLLLDVVRFTTAGSACTARAARNVKFGNTTTSVVTANSGCTTNPSAIEIIAQYEATSTPTEYDLSGLILPPGQGIMFRKENGTNNNIFAVWFYEQ